MFKLNLLYHNWCPDLSYQKCWADQSLQLLYHNWCPDLSYQKCWADQSVQPYFTTRGIQTYLATRVAVLRIVCCDTDATRPMPLPSRPRSYTCMTQDHVLDYIIIVTAVFRMSVSPLLTFRLYTNTIILHSSLSDFTQNTIILHSDSEQTQRQSVQNLK